MKSYQTMNCMSSWIIRLWLTFDIYCHTRSNDVFIHSHLEYRILFALMTSLLTCKNISDHAITFSLILVFEARIFKHLLYFYCMSKFHHNFSFNSKWVLQFLTGACYHVFQFQSPSLSAPHFFFRCCERWEKNFTHLFVDLLTLYFINCINPVLYRMYTVWRCWIFRWS